MRTGQLASGVAQPLTLDTPSGPIAALASGADGPIVLLVPGYTGSKEDFAPVLDPLAAQGFQAVAIDLPGQYQSPGPADPAGYSPDALATQLLHVAGAMGVGAMGVGAMGVGAMGVEAMGVGAMGARMHLLGHSFGGLVARAAVIAEPGRFTSLVLLSSGPAAIGGERRRRIELLEPVLARHGVAGVYAASLAAEQAVPGYVAPPPELAAFLRTRFLAGSPAMLQGMGDALRSEPDRVSELAATGVPRLVLHGASDDAWPPAVQAEMARRLGAEYAIVPDAAHSAAVENPEATVAALSAFWRAHG